MFTRKKIFPPSFPAFIKKVEALRVDIDYGDMVDILEDDVSPHMVFFQGFFIAITEYIKRRR
jgi:hypothetical protein